MPTRKLRTEDIVGIADFKVTLNSSHPSLFVTSGQHVNDVLNNVDTQVLSLRQKAAIDQVLSRPSIFNPVVLKNDLDGYLPAVSVGEFRDGVATFADLPTSGNTVGDMRVVRDEAVVYRWAADAAWQVFIQVGTLSHNILTNANVDSRFQHLQYIEKARLLNLKHTHVQKPHLDAIASVGSGRIISSGERDKIPTGDQKEAMSGTAYEPSVLNRFVTSQDPRLNTLKNPYITYGLEGTLATFQKEDVEFLLAALAFINQASSTVASLQVLPGAYRPNFQGDARPVVWASERTAQVTKVWNTTAGDVEDAVEPYREVEINSLLLESIAHRTSVFTFECFDSGLQLSGPGTSPATVRGLVFELKSNGTAGIKISRPGTLIEECTFRAAPGALLSQGLRGITVEAPGCTIRRCIFEGVLTEGLVVDAENTRVEECQFNLSSPSSKALQIKSAGDYTITNNCTFYQGSIYVESQAVSSLFTSCTHVKGKSNLVDSGLATRWLSNRPGALQQAYIGRTRTLGGPHSFADFTGDTQDVFNEALSDPYTREVVVLSGSNFTFSSTVEVPEGVVVRAGDYGQEAPQIVSTGSSPLFRLASNSALSGLGLTAANSDLIEVAANAVAAEVSRCTLHPLTSGFFGVVGDGASESLTVKKVVFIGDSGLRLNGADKCFISENIFETVASPLVLDATSVACHVKNNYFVSSQEADFSGSKHIIEQNYFIGAVPTKVNTSLSVWQANWPHPQTNNQDGVDTLKLSLVSTLAPINGTAASRSLANGVNVLAFEETGEGTAATLPQKLSSRLNRALGFEVNLFWSSSKVFTGTVLWEVTVTFRDRSGLDLGLPVTKVIASDRSQLLYQKEDKAAFSFTTADYGYMPGVSATHYSVVVRRMTENVLDTLAGTAYLTEVQLTLPRD